MTSIRRAGDKLFIHSPTPLACGLKARRRTASGRADAARSAVDVQKDQARTEVGREDDDRLEPERVIFAHGHW